MSAPDPAALLRGSLRANAAFSSLSGLVFALASGAVAERLGGIPPALVLAVGANLLVFAGALLWLASRPLVSVPLAVGVIAADWIWVIGTIGLVQAGVLPRDGAAIALGIAAVVAGFALLQSVGLRRLSRI